MAANRGPVDQIELATRRLRYLEKLAISELQEFNEIEGEQEETSDTFRFSVEGIERRFKATDEKSRGLLIMLDQVFNDFVIAFGLLDKMRDHPTFENAMKLAGKSMYIAELTIDVVMTLDGYWVLGEEAQAERDRREKKRQKSRQEKTKMYQDAVEKKKAEGHEYSPATELVADELGVSGATVRDYTVNIKPQNAGGRRHAGGRRRKKR